MGYFLAITWFTVLIAVVAFLCEYLDSSLGMGYGTTLTPVLLLFGFEPTQIVPAVLLSEFITGLLSGVFHTLFQNVQLSSNKQINNRSAESTPEGYGSSNFSEHHSLMTSKRNNALLDKLRNLTEDTKVISILAIFGVLGTIIAAVLSTIFSYTVITKCIIKLYIGTMVLAMGLVILVFINKTRKFSFKKIVLLGAIAGFNKGISGGGYGPITVSGQILSGRESRNAIGSTSLAEGIVCFAGVITYIITNIIQSSVLGTGLYIGEFSIAPYLIIGAIISAPLAALTTKKISNRWIKVSIGIATILLGIFSLSKTLSDFLGFW
ncbi:MAG: TSUP family transporter [Candidatus Heimdallarchaeota archaeon]|nr:TSUP family transporter [Candidatus Heimdallarchaeota archaeon]